MLRYHVHAHTILSVPLSSYHCQILYNTCIKEKEVGGREEGGKEKLHTCACTVHV